MDFGIFQDMITKIDGVISVRIIHENDEMKEVHIIANNLRAPKQIVRDIESSLIAAFDYRIDRKLISIAQIHTDDSEPVKRLRYNGINLKTEGAALECSVSLIYNEEEYSEVVHAVKTAANRKKIVANAAIRSVEKILGQAFLFDIEDVILSSSRDIEFVSVIVNMIVNEAEHTTVGSAIVKQDINEAVVKATLDAVNRRIERGTF